MKTSDLNLFMVDDEPDDLKSLVTLLVARNYRVQLFNSGESFLERADTQSSGCVLLDLGMGGGMNGLQVFEELRNQNSPLVVMLFSGKLDIPTSTRYTRRGVFECIEKTSEASYILDTVQRAMERAAELKEARTRWNTLTPRERDVARVWRKGMSARDCGMVLGINERTIQTNVGHIYEKLEVDNPTELDRFMRDHNIN